MATLIIGIIMVVLSLILMIYLGIKTDESLDTNWLFCWLAWVVLFFGMVSIVCYSSNRPYHTKNHNVRTEIRQEYVNGREISADTIYYFTPKKK